eukprot:10776359-Lingulodinium_polyedra.AAC.1
MPACDPVWALVVQAFQLAPELRQELFLPGGRWQEPVQLVDACPHQEGILEVAWVVAVNHCHRCMLLLHYCSGPGTVSH